MHLVTDIILNVFGGVWAAAAEVPEGTLVLRLSSRDMTRSRRMSDKGRVPSDIARVLGMLSPKRRFVFCWLKHGVLR